MNPTGEYRRINKILEANSPGTGLGLPDQNHPLDVVFGAGALDNVINVPNLEKVSDALSSFLFEISASCGTPPWKWKSSRNVFSS